MYSIPPLTSEQQLLLDQFQQGDFQTRWDLARQLLRVGPAIIPSLGQLLSFDPAHPELDWFIARLLGAFEHPSTIPTLTRLLQHPDPEVQAQTSGALAHLGILAIPTLQAQLQHPGTCLLAVQALSQIDDDQVIPLLIRVVDNPQAPVRETALAALSRFACADRIPELLPLYLAALTDHEPKVRSQAINTLGRIASLETRPVNPAKFPDLDWVGWLAPPLWDLSLEVAQQAALALGHLGTDAATLALQKRLQSPAALPLILKMIHALAWIATRPAIAALEQVWQTQTDPSIHQEIATVLGRLPNSAQPQATHLLLQQLQTSPDLPPAVKQAIIHSLGSLGQPQALDALIALLADPHPGVQLHVVAALKQLNPALSYQSLQTKVQDPSLSQALHQGLSLALREW